MAPEKRVSDVFEEEEVSLFSYLEVIVAHKKLLLLLMFLGGFFGYLLFQKTNHPVYVSEITVDFGFKGIEQHKNPDGSSFSANILTAPSLIRSVEDDIKESGLTLHDIRRHLSIIPIIPQRQSSPAPAGEEKEVEVFPNQYKVQLKTFTEKPYNKELREKILTRLYDHFSEDFTRRYQMRRILPEHKLINMSDQEFAEHLSFSSSAVDRAIASLKKLLAEYSIVVGSGKKAKEVKITPEIAYFNSSRAEHSFNDLLSLFQELKRFEIRKAESLLKGTGVTNNPTMKINLLKLKMRETKQKMEENLATAKAVQGILKEISKESGLGSYAFNKKQKRVISQAGVTLDKDVMKELVQNDYQAKLISTWMTSAVQAATQEKKINAIIDDINQLNSAYNHEAEKKKVERTLKGIDKIINKLVQETNALYQEYMKSVVAGGVRLISPPSSYVVEKKPSIFILGGIGASGVFTLFFLFLRDAWRKRKSEKESPAS